MANAPFDSIRSAHEYVSLLTKQVQEVEASIHEDIAIAAGDGAARRLEALYVVDYKLRELSQHLTSSSRILNDLRILRRLLLGERSGVAVTDSTVEPV